MIKKIYILILLAAIKINAADLTGVPLFEGHANKKIRTAEELQLNERVAQQKRLVRKLIPSENKANKK